LKAEDGVDSHLWLKLLKVATKEVKQLLEAQKNYHKIFLLQMES